MNALAWSSQGWLLSCLYYERDACDPWYDSRFEALARDWLQPLLQQLRALDPSWLIHWMRYSEKGSHLRLQLWGEEAALRSQAMPMIERAVAALRATRPHALGSNMQLTELGRRLNERARAGELRPAGAHELAWLGQVGEEQVYGEPAIFSFVQRQLQLEAQSSLRVLAEQRPLSWRLRYWQNYADALAQRLTPSSEARALGLAFLAETWRETFSISRKELDTVEVPYRAEPSLQALPELSVAADGVAAWRAQSATRWAMQLLGLLHLCANRLGVSIVDEIRWASAGALQAWRGLDSDQRQEVRQSLNSAMQYWRTPHVHH